MKILVWHWGRRGSGPRIAADLVTSFRAVLGTDAVLSLASGAEIMRGPNPPECALPVMTYGSLGGFAKRWAGAPMLAHNLAGRIRALGADLAVCAMPAPLDLVMHAALNRAGLPYAVMVHDADLHPGDGFPFQMALQRQLLRRAHALIALTGHVAGRLREQGLADRKPLLLSSLPPLDFGVAAPPPRAHGGKLRLLSFGRLLPYKGLDILAGALAKLGPRADMEVRVVGQGPETPVLAALRRMPGVTVENRWVPEDEVGALMAWSDALLLSHREASQSGVAAAAIASRRFVVATDVGGLREQLHDEKRALLCAPDPAAFAAALHQLLAMTTEAEEQPQASWQGMAANLVEGLDGALLGRVRWSGRRWEGRPGALPLDPAKG